MLFGGMISFVGLFTDTNKRPALLGLGAAAAAFLVFFLAAVC
jgi:hypothetical protein